MKKKAEKKQRTDWKAKHETLEKLYEEAMDNLDELSDAKEALGEAQKQIKALEKDNRELGLEALKLLNKRRMLNLNIAHRDRVIADLAVSDALVRNTLAGRIQGQIKGTMKDNGVTDGEIQTYLEREDKKWETDNKLGSWADK